jgi:NADH-quinone oxidoreductase subunit N
MRETNAMLLQILLPEIFLVVTACVLFLLSLIARNSTGRAAASIALIGVVAAFTMAAVQHHRLSGDESAFLTDAYQGLRLTGFSLFVRLAALFVAIVLVLLNWPSDRAGTGNASVNWGKDAGEFFGLLLLSFTGLILSATANDLILLFLAIELASIPTYILVSVGRPLAQAQEAGVKYFFLGAMAAAILLMGFAYLYGVTGTTNLAEIAAILARQPGGVATLSSWQLLAGVMLVLGLAFKLAAVPLHAYAADVYQGAATSVTAVLGFVPKTVGIVVLVKVVHAFAGNGEAWIVAPQFAKLLWAIAVLTMTVGNLLALLQRNVKRTLAYSSVAHSGYLIAGVTFAVIGSPEQRPAALAAVLFYLLIYGLTSTASFGALQLIPSRASIETSRGSFAPPTTTAETYDDLAGAAKTSPLGAWVLAIACFSLVGLPLTGGFWAKYYLLVPGLSGLRDGGAMTGWAIGLAVAILVNSAISAAYYLGIVATLFTRAEPAEPGPRPREQTGVLIGTLACAAIVLLVGLLPGTVGRLAERANSAARGFGGATVAPAAPAPAVTLAR